MANTTRPFALEPERVMTQFSLLIDGTPLSPSLTEIVPCSPVANTNTPAAPVVSEPAPDYDKALLALDRELDSALFDKAARRISAQKGYLNRLQSVEVRDADNYHSRQFVTLADIRFIKLIQNGRPTLACRAGDLGKALELHGANTDSGRTQSAVNDLIHPHLARAEFLIKWHAERLHDRWDNDYTTDGRDWGYWDCNCVYAAPGAGADYITIEGAMRLARQYRCDALWVKLNNAYLNYYYPPKQWEREAKAANDAAAAFLQQDNGTTVTASAQEQLPPLPGEAYLPIADMTHEELELFMDVSIGVVCTENGDTYFVYDEEEWALFTEVADELGYEPYYTEEDSLRDYYTEDSEARLPTYGPKRSKHADAPVKEAV